MDKNQFDYDYLTLRKLVASGKIKVQDAKNWIQANGSKAGDKEEEKAMKSVKSKLTRFMKTAAE